MPAALPRGPARQETADTVTTPDPYLGQRTLMRAILDATLPPGTAWHPSPGGDFDHLLDGIGDDLQTVET